MSNTKISKRVVDELEPQAKRYTLWDGDLPAFGIEVMPSGAKSYRLMYRHHGRARKLTLGRHGAITPDEARKLARFALGRIAHGEDPAGAKLAERQGQRYVEAFEAWLERHVDAKKKPATRFEYRRLFEREFKGHFGTRKLSDITRADVSALHRKLADRPYLANRAIAVLRSFFAWCERQGWRPENSNPARLIERYREAKRDRLLTGEELGRLGQALRDSEGKEWPWALAAIRLILLTGARRGEILALRWAEVDLGASVARLPDSKTGAKNLYLSSPARDVLERVHRMPDNPFVICGSVKGQPLIGLPKAWSRIRQRAGLDDVRIHDLRHAFASSAAMGGLPLLTIGRLLGHSQPAVTDRYAHFASSPLVAAADQVAEIIAGQLAPPADGMENE